MLLTFLTNRGSWRGHWLRHWGSHGTGAGGETQESVSQQVIISGARPHVGEGSGSIDTFWSCQPIGASAFKAHVTWQGTVFAISR